MSQQNVPPPDGHETSHTAGWQVSPWVHIPRLELLLDCAPGDLTWADIEALVSRRTPEDLTLEFKSELYARTDSGKHEMVKDITALANASGGLIILGVKEDGAGKASALSPVDLGEVERRRMVEVITKGAAPLLPDLTVGELPMPREPSRGVFLLLVPGSPDAPHGIRRNDGFAWPVREDRLVRWMSEPELASRYRNRFAGGEAQAARLDSAERDGLACLDTKDRGWLSLTLSPARSGRLDADRDRYREWLREHLTGLPVGLSVDSAAVPGRRRVIFTDRYSFNGVSVDHHLELHSDGTGFAGIVIASEEASDSEQRGHAANLAVSSGDIAIWSLVLLDVLAHHAVHSGGGGPFEVRARLTPGFDGSYRLPPGMPMPSPPRLPLVIVEPFEVREAYFGDRTVPGGRLLTGPTPLDVVAPPSVVTSSRDLVAVAAEISQEIVAEFGALSQDMPLRRDGTVSPSTIGRPRLTSLAGWAKAMQVLAAD